MITRLAAPVAVLALLTACASVTNGTPDSTPRAVVPTSSPSVPTPSVDRPPTSPPATTTAPSTGTTPVPDSPIRTKIVTSTAGRVYSVAIWAERTSEDCAGHAYGQVADFLTSHDCTGIRQLLATTAINGRSVGFAQNTVGFGGSMQQSYAAAGAFTRLVSANGTGNLNDLLREGYRLPAGPDEVPQPDAFSALGQDAGVVVTDGWFLDHSTPENDPRLLRMAQALFLQI